MAELKDKDEQYDAFLNYHKKNKKNKKEKKEKKEKKHIDFNIKGKLLVTFRALFLVFFVVALTYLIMYIVSNFYDFGLIAENFMSKNPLTANMSGKPDLTPTKFNFKMLSRYQNILILGVDSNGPNTLPYSGVRSDTIIIINVDLHGKSVNAISIPRDSKVYISEGHGIQKINSAYALGGIELTKKTIEETLGIKIHNYIVMNAEGVVKLIDAIGGVPIHIDQNMHYQDDTAKLYINFTKGDYVLSGKQAEEYLRFRKDSMGDIGRVHRQQKFIKALFEQAKSPETLRKTPEVLKIASLYTRTDLNLYQMSQYAAIAKDIDLNKVEFVMLPGAPNKKGIISYWILDPDKTQKVINRLIYRQKAEMAQNEFSVGIMYSRLKELEAMAIKEELKTMGYDVNCTGRSTQIKESEIIGYNTQITNDMIKAMQRKIPDISKFKYVHSPVRNYCNTSDVVITIKDDEDDMI